MSNRLAINIPGLSMKNPLMPASGTFGFGDVAGASKFDLNKMGAMVMKTTTPHATTGNPQPQIAQLDDGVLNSVGLTNPGVDAVINDKMFNFHQQYPILPIVASIGGDTESDYVEVAQKLAHSGLANALELNVSCPNVASGGMSFGVDPKTVESLTSQVKAVTSKVPVYVKLTPNVTDITEIARAAEAGGADGLSLINTVLGLHIDIRTRKAVLGKGMGGFSGHAVKPIAVRMIYQVRQVTNLPIIGMGGVETPADVIEFFLAGADAIAVGTAHFKHWDAIPRIADGLVPLMDQLGIASLEELRHQR